MRNERDGRPLLLLDMDGPLNPYRAAPHERPAGYSTHRMRPTEWGNRGTSPCGSGSTTATERTWMPEDQKPSTKQAWGVLNEYKKTWAKRTAVRKAPPITDELLRAMVATCDLRGTAGRRDRCMLLLGRGPSNARSSSQTCPSPTTPRSSTRSRPYGTGSPPSTTSASAKARSSGPSPPAAPSRTGPSQRNAATTSPGTPSTTGAEAVPTRPAPGTVNRSLPTGSAVRSTGHRGSGRGPDEAGPAKTGLGGREAGVSGPRAVQSGESLAQGAGQAAREDGVTLRTLPWMPSPSPHSPGRPFKE